MAGVTMPQLGESITEGTIAKWLKKPGDQVKKYESLVEVITDKVNAEVPAPFAGTLTEIKVPEGTTVNVGTEICVIAEAGSPAVAPASAPESPAGPAGMVAEPTAGPPRELAGPAPRQGSEPGGRARLSPAVRAMVEEHKISDEDLSRIRGSGEGDRVTKKDLETFLSQRSAKSPPADAQRPAAKEDTPAAGAPAKPAGERVPLTPMRRAIATNMVKSKQTIPHAWTVAEVDMTNVVRFRQAAREQFRQREGVDLTYVPLVVKGVVEGLKAVPALNASWAEDGVRLHKDINIGIAVSVDDGLILPVIKQADRLSIAGLARAVDDLGRRARAGKLTLEDVQGGTFTVNNPGTFGTLLSYSIIAPPQAGILAMDAIIKRPVVVEGDAIAVRSMMNLCLSFDHRILDGVSAARFLQGLRSWLEGFSEQVPLY